MSQLIGDLFAGSFHAPLQLALGYGTGKAIEYTSRQVKGDFRPLAQLILNGVACAILKNIVFQSSLFSRDPTAGTYFIVGIGFAQPSLITDFGHVAETVLFKTRNAISKRVSTMDGTGTE